MPTDPEPLAGELVTAIDSLREVFEARGIRYPLLGGLATMLRGRPRFTQDVDADLIRSEWSSLSQGEEPRTAWLETELAAIKR